MNAPLAETLRPKSLDAFCGQEHITCKEGILRRLLSEKRPLSLLFWGPPGCGKTTLAKIYASAFQSDFASFSATEGSVADFKEWLKYRRQMPLFSGKNIVFIDEIHRFNKSQQDVFLPLIEKGEIVLIGATTENPSFSLNHALLSRFRVLTLEKLDGRALEKMIEQFITWSNRPAFSKAVTEKLLLLAEGDGRHLMNILEHIHLLSPTDEIITEETLGHLATRSLPQYDKNGDQHYNLISALHKSVRGSDPDASVYWLCRMIAGGEDPKYIARRMVRMAMEDVGLADPSALTYILSCKEAYEMLGSPEGEISLAMGIIYLALAPKSNACYRALQKGSILAKESSSLTPPKHILNAPTGFMKKEGYGEGYLYDHDIKEGFSGQNYFPSSLERKQLYTPVERGFEREMAKRLNFFNALREKAGREEVLCDPPV